MVARRGARRRGALRVLLGARRLHPQRSRFMRAKALAEQAVVESSLQHDGVRAVDRLRAGRSVPETARAALAAAGDARSRARAARAFQPIWAQDVADCVIAALPGGAIGRRATARATSWPDPRRSPTRRSSSSRCAASAAGARSCTSRCRSSARASRLVERLMGPAAFATWDEAELMEVPLIASTGRRRRAPRRGAAPMRTVLGAG